MTIREARLLSGFSQTEAEKTFGIPHRTLQNHELLPVEKLSWLDDMLIREFLRESVDDAGYFAVVRFDDPAEGRNDADYDDLIRYNSISDAENAFRTLTTKYAGAMSKEETRFVEWGIYECDTEWNPVTLLKNDVITLGEKDKTRITWHHKR